MAKKQKDRYVAYVSSYTQGSRHGIRIFHVDLDLGRFIPKAKVEIRNSSYACVSHNGRFLYSITDSGVESYNILADGGLELINFATINGMRGCYIATDYADKYLFVSGYHDGKLTVLALAEDGSIGEITEEIFHKGIGSLAERNFRPHITCARMTRDNKYLLVADQGMDYVNVYRLDHRSGKLKLADVLRSDMESAPRHIKLSQDGRFVYVLHEWKSYIDVYEYKDEKPLPKFEKLQTISTLAEKSKNSAACAFAFSADSNYLIASNAGENTVIIYKVDQASGLLSPLLCLPISGEYPKDVDIFPNNRFVVASNNESNTLTFFSVDLEKGLIVMNGPALEVPTPNCLVFHRLRDED